jgi:hypothetical protein
MYFVPEGQHDSSQARSAWSHEENCPVPAGRLNGSRLRLEANKAVSAWIHQTSTVPPGRGSLYRYPGTSCLATITLPLRDKSHSPIEGPRIKLAPFSSHNVRCVFSTKNRQPLLVGEIKERFWASMGGMAKQNEIKPLCIGAGQTITVEGSKDLRTQNAAVTRHWRVGDCR